ncbi:MAG: hypothetical protein AB7F09_05655 [Parvibaculaceae bacterium]
MTTSSRTGCRWFRRFVLENRESISDIIATRRLVKTDLRRAVCLRAMVVEAARRLSADGSI